MPLECSTIKDIQSEAIWSYTNLRKGVCVARADKKKESGELTLFGQDVKEFWAFTAGQKDNKGGLLLLNNVQFIYELQLAKLELKALGAEFNMLESLREFDLIKPTQDVIDLILKRSSYFRSLYGIYTDYYKILKKNRTRSVNQYLTHWIYPYKGKFHPQLVRALLSIIGLAPGEVVLDPFSGSGTSAVEAQLLGIDFLGVDISPLCVLQGLVKTQSIYAVEEILKVRDEVLSLSDENVLNGELYYAMIDRLSSDDRVRNFYKLLRLVTLSDTVRRNRDFLLSFRKNMDLMIGSVNDMISVINELSLQPGRVQINVGDARQLKLDDNSVDGIVTSPPYSIALDYVKNDEHSMKDLGCNVADFRENVIGVRGSGNERLDLYEKDIMLAYQEMYRVLKPGKQVAIVLGNATYQGREVKTVEFTISYMESLGFHLVENIEKIIFGLYNVMKNENILIFRKGGF